MEDNRNLIPDDQDIALASEYDEYYSYSRYLEIEPLTLGEFCLVAFNTGTDPINQEL